jgi:hypothetical protein
MIAFTKREAWGKTDDLKIRTLILVNLCSDHTPLSSVSLDIYTISSKTDLDSG